MPRKRTDIQKIIEAAQAIEEKSALEANALGFMARAMVQTTMPHSEPEGHHFERTNGSLTFTMIANPKYGLPYGSMPRVLMAWLSTEAAKHQERKIPFGKNLSAFMRELGLVQATGGEWGSITRLRNQTERLFQCAVFCSTINEKRSTGKALVVADAYDLWWDPTLPTEESYVKLSETFFNEIIASPVPIDMRAIRALQRSPMALDIYCWITHRMSYLKDPVEIPWELLQLQFGADYPETPHGKRDFKRKFLRHLLKVQVLYPGAESAKATEQHLYLTPDEPHIRRRGKVVVVK